MTRQIDPASGDLLRAGDPAPNGSGLTPSERALLRQHLLAELAARRPRRRRWMPAAMAVAAIVATLVTAILLRPLSEPPPAEHPPPTRESREIRFTTPGGTQVIWTLDPSFEL